jgi:hypothetical protein
MILRSFRGVVARGREAEFYAIVRDRVERFRVQFELVETHIARRSDPDGEHFLVTTHWLDWDTLLAWSGGDVERPWGSDELLAMLTSWEIEHFEEINGRTLAADAG